MNNIETIFGAPGCGKTTHLINLLGELLKEYEPNEIAFVSFTKKGSYEGRDRAMEKFGYKENDFPFFRTIHSLGFRHLGISQYEMISRKNYREFSNALGMHFLGYYTEDLVNSDDKYLFQLGIEKNNQALAEKTKADLDIRKLNYVRANYERYKKELGVWDYDDLIKCYLDLGATLPVKVAIIDEAQDLTSMQWEFCFKAFKECENVYIAGDDDQAIYEWSGADVFKFLDVAKSGTMKILDRSYRLKETILEYSKKLLKQISVRVDKNFSADQGKGNIYFHNSLEEITINNEQSFYFLSRNNCFLKTYKDYIIKTGMQFSVKGKDFGKISIYKMIMKYEELRQTDPEAIKLDVLLSEKLRPTATPLTPWYDALELPEDELSFWRNFFANKNEIKNTGLNVSTIHGVKGGEADNVVLSLNITKNVNNAVQSKHSIDSELRCLYVGMTRTKKNLHIIHSTAKFGYEQIIPTMERAICF